MAKDNRITFYDLALSTGATISPFVWPLDVLLLSGLSGYFPASRS